MNIIRQTADRHRRIDRPPLRRADDAENIRRYAVQKVFRGRDNLDINIGHIQRGCVECALLTDRHIGSPNIKKPPEAMPMTVYVSSDHDESLDKSVFARWDSSPHRTHRAGKSAVFANHRLEPSSHKP